MVGQKWVTRQVGSGEELVFEKILVSPGPFQVNFYFGSGINQDPIGFNVRVSVSGPIEFARMIFVSRRQGLVGEQKFDQRFQFFEVFAAFL